MSAHPSFLVMLASLFHLGMVMAEDVRGGSAVRAAARPTGTGWQADAAAAYSAVAASSRLLRRQRRRLALLGAVVLLLVSCGVYVGRGGSLRAGSPSPSWEAAVAPDWPTLRGLMPRNVRIGSAVDAVRLAEDPRYRAGLAADFTALTPENAMKWANLEPTPDRYDWTTSDRVIDFARANGQAVYGHTLVWHSSVPAWVSEEWSAEQLRAALREHVTTVVSRYRGRVWAWDVANEVLDEDGRMRDSILLRKLGPGYVADAFRWAHEADPDARLFINDYGTETGGRKADGMFRLVKALRAAGAPVQGIGFQSHLQWDRPPADLTENLRRFARLGVSVAVTELDVRIRMPVTAEKLARQALIYQYVLAACLEVATCESFTVWGFTDALSWIPHHYPGHGAACLFDEDLRPKPAHDALVRELRQRAAVAPG